jgi:hypothetical protein
MPCIGYAVMSQMASANTTIQTLIDDEYRGRVMALYSMTVVGLGPFGSWRQAPPLDGSAHAPLSRPEACWRCRPP